MAETEITPTDKDVVDSIIFQHESAQEDLMGNLHNRFVGYISEAKIPLPLVVTVLNMLLQEAVEMAYKKYMRG